MIFALHYAFVSQISSVTAQVFKTNDPLLYVSVPLYKPKSHITFFSHLQYLDKMSFYLAVFTIVILVVDSYDFSLLYTRNIQWSVDAQHV